jgi:predicted small lipoprotein YifL
MRLLTVILSCLFIAACGQTGPLVLPEEPAPEPEPTEEPTDSGDENQDER